MVGGVARAGIRFAFLASAVWLAMEGRADAQLGTLLSPGVLTKAHAELEGIANCQKCHEAGRGITAAKCLSCHKPVADRIARRFGVHRDVKGECVSCHVEHTGADGELRPFDQSAFDHAGVAGFPLDGRHAALAGRCAACHKSRSFLTARAACDGCHKDVHAGRLGSACSSCHTTRVPFKDVVAGGRFDHSKTAFPLTGAHSSVGCASCHANGAYKGLSFSSCTSCHKSPHAPSWGAVCTTCHTTNTWRTSRIDHARTAFPLVGRHTAVACASCHRQSAMKVKPRSDTCAACHVDVHRGTFKQDCRACHSENSFAKAPFDHRQTKFPLDGRHEAVACAGCHKPPAIAARGSIKPIADFRGLRTACVSCHADVHAGELGAACESCHTSATFTVANFRHARFPDFFGGEHALVSCSACHAINGRPQAPAKAATVGAARPVLLNVRFTSASITCVSCHKDVHLGQVGAECQRCHTVQQKQFAVAGFSHAATLFPLTGKHAKVECSLCHKPVTGAFPAGAGTAVRLKGIAVACRTCHEDVHLGQVDSTCETCHSTDAFAIHDYRHRNTRLRDFFVGRHVSAPCAACHVAATRDFPAGRGKAMAFAIDARCTACHRDEHNGALPDCARCHRP